MAIWTIAKKETRLLARGPRAGVILLAMPFVFILVLGLSLGKEFGQKPDDRLRVTLVDLDRGYTDPVAAAKEAASRFAWLPGATAQAPGISSTAFAACTTAGSYELARFPNETWAKIVRRDLAETASIRVEVIPTREEAEQL